MLMNSCCSSVDIIKYAVQVTALCCGLAIGMMSVLSTSVITELALIALTGIPIWLGVFSWSIRDREVETIGKYINLLGKELRRALVFLPLAIIGMVCIHLGAE